MRFGRRPVSPQVLPIASCDVGEEACVAADPDAGGHSGACRSPDLGRSFSDHEIELFLCWSKLPSRRLPGGYPGKLKDKLKDMQSNRAPATPGLGRPPARNATGGLAGAAAPAAAPGVSAMRRAQSAAPIACARLELPRGGANDRGSAEDDRRLSRVPPHRGLEARFAGIHRARQWSRLIKRRTPKRVTSSCSRWHVAAVTRPKSLPCLSFSSRADQAVALVPNRSKIAASSREIVAFPSWNNWPV
jgi:hypothetical protein